MASSIDNFINNLVHKLETLYPTPVNNASVSISTITEEPHVDHDGNVHEGVHTDVEVELQHDHDHEVELENEIKHDHEVEHEHEVELENIIKQENVAVAPKLIVNPANRASPFIIRK